MSYAIPVVPLTLHNTEGSPTRARRRFTVTYQRQMFSAAGRLVMWSEIRWLSSPTRARGIDGVSVGRQRVILFSLGLVAFIRLHVARSEEAECPHQIGGRGLLLTRESPHHRGE